jgi:hypothetical protein
MDAFVQQSWLQEVRRAYVHSETMTAEEFEELLDAAMRGEWPHHPELPAYPAFQLEEICC